MAASPSTVERTVLCRRRRALDWLHGRATSGPMRTHNSYLLVHRVQRRSSAERSTAFTSPGGPGPFAHALLLAHILPSSLLAGMLAHAMLRACSLPRRPHPRRHARAYTHSPSSLAVWLSNLRSLCELPACMAPEYVPCAPRS